MVAWPNRSRVDRKPIRLCRLGRSTYAHSGCRHHTRAYSASNRNAAAARHSGANFYAVTNMDAVNHAYTFANIDTHCDADSDDFAAPAIGW